MLNTVIHTIADVGAELLEEYSRVGMSIGVVGDNDVMLNTTSNDC